MSLEISYILKIPTNEFFSGKQPGTVYVERAESVVGKAWMRSGEGFDSIHPPPKSSPRAKTRLSHPRFSTLSLSLSTQSNKL